MFANYVNGRYIKNSKSRNMTMVGLLKWVSHGSVYVNVNGLFTFANYDNDQIIKMAESRFGICKCI